MYARNRRTGSEITGTHERLEARADTIRDKFKRSTEGGIKGEHDGYTHVFWNSQETLTKQGETVYLDDEGEEVPESEIELVNDLSEPLTPVPATAGSPDVPALDKPGRTTDLNETAELYEVVHPDTGSGHGRYTELSKARDAGRPTDLIARTVYRTTSETTYVPNCASTRILPPEHKNPDRERSQTGVETTMMTREF